MCKTDIYIQLKVIPKGESATLLKDPPKELVNFITFVSKYFVS